MFQFLNPIWLFAATALIIPVLIHLWNIRPGKVLKVGSISLIDPASRKSSRSFKLLDIPLFIVRCLLLLVLALLLSMPVWQKKLQPAKVKGWIMIPKESFASSYQNFKTRIDSLTKAGYEFHYFNTGFPKSNLTQILLHRKDSISSSSKSKVTPNYWNLIKQLDTQVASALPVYIFTPNRAGYFTGSKPEVALNLHWQTFIPADSASTWIQQAWFTNSNTIRIVQGNGKATGTTFSYATVQSDNPAYTISTNNGQPVISLANNRQSATAIDTNTLRIAIYTDNATADAAYLKAALQAVADFTQRKTVIKQYSNPGSIPTTQNWLFWLSEKTVPARLAQQNVLLYEKGKPANANSWMHNSGLNLTALQQEQKIALFKLIAAPNSTQQPIWQDGFGHPVLSLQASAHNLYRFYSRFNPSWNDLVWSNEFPAWLLKLLTTKQSAINSDKRALSQQQLMPELINETHTPAVKLTGITDLKPYFWLVLALLFLAERWLAHREPKTQGHD